ncbi:MAG: pyruvate:ferredoxin (flavodoxin) oxidoreductase [Candidatus Sericytochromatia bacterium]|nr:pyruvate:ferredoxin (flavodoxin) oxidoreductase [Candidatus Sericytochromatia bacterium]
MSAMQSQILDANEAVARVAYATHELIAIYPITPASPMAEWSDTWASQQQPNLWGDVPRIIEMQSEGGAAGAVHGALQAGMLTTTFTASQGLLLMIPNMYKIAGELTPMVMHVAARALAAQGLSIFGDHGDVMAARSTGWGMLCSNSVQEAQDFALLAQAVSLRSRLPFVHFFDGFRTSHELNQIALLRPGQMLEMLDKDAIRAHRQRALNPAAPVIRGTAQNPDVYFQGRESVNPYYQQAPDIMQGVMDDFARLTGRTYRCYEYHGASDAERVIVLMGSGAEAVHETVDALCARGEKVGVLKVRLFRPFGAEAFVQALPASVQRIAVLDRCKESGASGEPLYLDVLQAVSRHASLRPEVIGGRYGLGSKEFNPAMIKAVFDELLVPQPRQGFTIGIEDDLCQTSLPFDPDWQIEPENVYRALFYGLGSDGTVGANKNTLKIIGESTTQWAQGYFVYDSKKAGAQTISHLRFGPSPIRSSYLIQKAHFIGCHQPGFLTQYEILDKALPGAVLLLNTPEGPDSVWEHLPRSVQTQIQALQLKFHVIDAHSVAREAGLGHRINTIMQTAFFAISGVLPRDKALDKIRTAITKTYARKGPEIIAQNLQAVEAALSHLYPVDWQGKTLGQRERPLTVAADAPAFVREVTACLLSGQGDRLPVSALPADGTWPSGTSQYEKRNLAHEIPVWDPDVCIQCGKCAMVCPHAVIRIKAYPEAELAHAPASFKATAAKDREWQDLRYSIQVAPEDCTGCELCVQVCPAKNKSVPRLKALNMAPQAALLEQEKHNWDFFLKLPELPRERIHAGQIRQQQVMQPLFEFSGACAGCGETPYLKLLSQLFGDHALIANATGCSSIYGGNLPTTPWTHTAEGRGPAWANSLFEDNAEFGLGLALGHQQKQTSARQLLEMLAPQLNGERVALLLQNPLADAADVYAQQAAIKDLKAELRALSDPLARELLALADALGKSSVWIVGGDGWAYDIGFGGLDHVLASGENVNILVMDTEVYSNTGGQTSKATPKGAVAKFSAGGKALGKKDLGLMAMSYGHVYVASVAMGAKDEHTLKVFLEAEAYPGPSLIIAYSHCIAHGINMRQGLESQKLAVKSGEWLLYRYDPRRRDTGQNPLQLDSKGPQGRLEDYLQDQNRFKMLFHSQPEAAQRFLKEHRQELGKRWALYQHLAQPVEQAHPTEKGASQNA